MPGTIQRTEMQAAIGNAPTDAAHDNAGIVYNYYQTTFGRDSYDGAGHEIRSTTHFGLDYNNAFWCDDACAAQFGSLPDGEQMAYGDGDGVQFSPSEPGPGHRRPRADPCGHGRHSRLDTSRASPAR